MTQRPPPLPSRPYHFPRFQRRQIENGVRIIVAPTHKLPLVTVSVVAEAGAVADPPGCEGLAQLTADLLLEGTAKHSGADIADQFERLGAAVEVETLWDISVVSMTALRHHIDGAVKLFGSLVHEPALPEREAERLKKERIAELLQQRAEPRGLADDMYARVLYGGASRFARPIGGTEKSVSAISPADVRAFFADRYRPRGLTVVVTGDITVEDAEKLVRGAFQMRSDGGPTAARVDDAPARRTRGLHLVAKDDAPQAELRVGNVGVPRGHPDYYSIVIMNAVLGGLFSSRINLNLRERHGYTYGASSRFEWRRQSGPFSISTAVQTDVTGAAAKEVLLEIDRMRDAEVAADELSLATSYLDGIFPIRYETTASIADALVMLTAFDLPDDFHDLYRDRIRAVTSRDVLKAAQDHLKPDALQMLVVGDVGALKPQLEELSFAPITMHDPKDDA